MRYPLLQRLGLLAALIGVPAPQLTSTVCAEPPTVVPQRGATPSGNTSSVAEAPARPEAVDLASADSQVRGIVVDSTGNPIATAEVLLASTQGKIAKTVTAANGEFQFAHIPPGLYTIASPGAALMVRVWPATSAPPAAKPTLLLVQQDALRGQGPGHQPGIASGVYDGGVMRAFHSPWLFAGVVGAGVAIPIIVLNDDDEDGS